MSLTIKIRKIVNKKTLERALCQFKMIKGFRESNWRVKKGSKYFYLI